MSESRTAPDFLSPRPQPRPADRRLWAAEALAAVSLLLLSASVRRDAWAADARLRPWLQRGCAVLGCRLPAWSEPSALRIQARDMRADPLRPDVLTMEVAFRNDAASAQAWPCLRLRLDDVAGQALASGVFAPSQYLQGEVPAQIAAGQVANARLQVRDAGRRAVGFDLGFERCPFSETAPTRR